MILELSCILKIKLLCLARQVFLFAFIEDRSLFNYCSAVLCQTVVGGKDIHFRNKSVFSNCACADILPGNEESKSCTKSVGGSSDMYFCPRF